MSRRSYFPRALLAAACLSPAWAAAADYVPDHYIRDKVEAYDAYRQRVALQRRDAYRNRAGLAAARYSTMRAVLADPRHDRRWRTLRPRHLSDGTDQDNHH